jgi:polar amino acid transport system permease protein
VNLIQGRNFRAFEAFIIGTAIYLVLSIALRRLLNWIGPRFISGR